jgi:TonB family protein
MRRIVFTSMCLALSISSTAQGPWQPPRVVKAELGAEPWNAISGGVAACEVALNEKGAVVGVEVVQDVAPFGTLLRDAVRSWQFEAAVADGVRTGAHVLVLGFFRPSGMTLTTPESPRYKTTSAPADIPWPTLVAVPPYPPNLVGSGKVLIEADISGEGAVASARVVAPGSAFDSAALDTARQWKFRPATKGGRGVPSRAFLVFSFVGMTP